MYIDEKSIEVKEGTPNTIAPGKGGKLKDGMGSAEAAIRLLWCESPNVPGQNRK